VLLVVVYYGQEAPLPLCGKICRCGKRPHQRPNLQITVDAEKLQVVLPCKIHFIGAFEVQQYLGLLEPSPDWDFLHELAIIIFSAGSFL